METILAGLTLWGVKVSVTPLILIAFAIFLVDSIAYVRRHWSHENGWSYFLTGIVISIVVLLSITLHEIGHALLCLWTGCPILGAGMSWWGAWVEHGNFSSPGQMAIIAMAGPAMNFLIAIVATLYVKIYPESLVENSVQYIAYINVRLGIFNLFPLIVLDGGKLLYSITWGISGKYEAMFVPTLVAGLILTILLFVYRARNAGKGWEDKLEKL